MALTGVCEEQRHQRPSYSLCVLYINTSNKKTGGRKCMAELNWTELWAEHVYEGHCFLAHLWRITSRILHSIISQAWNMVSSISLLFLGKPLLLPSGLKVESRKNSIALTKLVYPLELDATLLNGAPSNVFFQTRKTLWLFLMWD